MRVTFLLSWCSPFPNEKVCKKGEENCRSNGTDTARVRLYAEPKSQSYKEPARKNKRVNRTCGELGIGYLREVGVIFVLDRTHMELAVADPQGLLKVYPLSDQMMTSPNTANLIIEQS